MPRKAVTAAELRSALARFPDDMEVWVQDGASAEGHAPIYGTSPAVDPDPADGEPEEFVVLLTDA